MDRFNDVGFLSPELQGWTNSARQEFKCYFDAAERINRLSMKVLFDLAAEEMENAHVVANLCYGRSLQSFQSTLVLAERGALADARNAVKSSAESAIALAVAKHHPDILTRLEEDHDNHFLKMINIYLQVGANGDQDNTFDFSQAEATKQEILKEYLGSSLRAIVWSSLAQKSDAMDLSSSEVKLPSIPNA